MVDMWAGIDAGKREHHCVVIDADGTQLLSQRVTNDEETLLGLIAEVCSLADGGHVTWAIDLNSGGAALVLTLLANHDQHVFSIPGHIIHHGAATYRGDAKTDAKDAAIIADQARMRREATPILTSGQLPMSKLATVLRGPDRALAEGPHVRDFPLASNGFLPAAPLYSRSDQQPFQLPLQCCCRREQPVVNSGRSDRGQVRVLAGYQHQRLCD